MLYGWQQVAMRICMSLLLPFRWPQMMRNHSSRRQSALAHQKIDGEITDHIIRQSLLPLYTSPQTAFLTLTGTSIAWNVSRLASWMVARFKGQAYG